MCAAAIDTKGWYGYYQPLLQRYARRLLHNEAAAFELTGMVLDFHLSVYGNASLAAHRSRLKENMELHCYYFLHCKAFDRAVSKAENK